MLPCFLFLSKHISTSLVSLRRARHGFVLPLRWVPRRPWGYPPAAPRRPARAAPQGLLLSLLAILRRLFAPRRLLGLPLLAKSSPTAGAPAFPRHVTHF